MSFPRFRSCVACVLLIGLAAMARASSAAPFGQMLTPDERVATGYAELDSNHARVLDALIQRDVDAARQGDVVAFAKSFTERRTAQEQRNAGIDRLTDAQRAQLDRLVAVAIAARPAPVPFVPASTGVAAGAVHTVPRRAEVHGEVSLFYGQSSGGGSFYGGSFDATVVDPSKRFALGVGYSEVHGRGFRGGCYDPFWTH